MFNRTQSNMKQISICYFLLSSTFVTRNAFDTLIGQLRALYFLAFIHFSILNERQLFIPPNVDGRTLCLIVVTTDEIVVYVVFTKSFSHFSRIVLGRFACKITQLLCVTRVRYMITLNIYAI